MYTPKRLSLLRDAVGMSSDIQDNNKTYAPLIESQNFVLSERKKGIIFPKTISFDDRNKLHEELDSMGYGYEDGKWVQKTPHQWGAVRTLNRQGYKCYRCDTSFAPPNPIAWKLRQIKSRRSGAGFHSSKQSADYKNMAAYCHPCYEKETSSAPKTIRFKKVKLEHYEKWMEENKWEVLHGSFTFSTLVKRALDELTDSEFFDARIGDILTENEEYKLQAESFLELLKMYNGREDDFDFAAKVRNFFQNYEPPIRPFQSDEEIDSTTTDNERLRKFLKQSRDEDLKHIIKNKLSGYKRYEEQFPEFKE
tara:strand:- start:1576 stop:2499 length:924 start_codon:yes stop_codon:yes gene_type:complete